MIGRFTLAEVDAFIDALDRTRGDIADWRIPFESLHEEYVRARRLRDVQLGLGRVLLLGAGLYYVARLYTVDWVIGALDHQSLTPLWLFIVVNAVLSLIPFLMFPVLRREDRVAALLRAFGADVPDHGADSDEHLPPQVAVALETLEKAKSPAGLRPSYETLETWQFRARHWTWNRFDIPVLWLLAFLTVMFGGNFGLPEFVRGAALMFAVMIAWLHLRRLHNRSGTVRRVEEALGRWRHLVPAMQEAAR